jgi:dsRNA-specific ribonuclease
MEADQTFINIIRQFLTAKVLKSEGVSLQGVGGVSIIPPMIIGDMVSPDNIIKCFLPVFTHASFDYNGSYERGEFKGDLLCNTFTMFKINSTIPDLDQNALSNMMSHYKSNAVFARDLKNTVPEIVDYLRKAPHVGITDKIYGDMFEALIWGVYASAETVITGLGFSCAYNVYMLLTRETKITTEYIQGHPKTVVLELLPKIDKQRTVSESSRSDGKEYTVEVTIDNESLQSLMRDVESVMGGRSKRIRQTEYSATKGSKEAATYSVYSEILATLREHGATSEVVSKIKLQRAMKGMSSETIAAIENKMTANKETLEFEKIDISDDEIEWRLIAVAKTGVKRYISSAMSSKSSTSFPAAKQEVLKVYSQRTK